MPTRATPTPAATRRSPEREPRPAAPRPKTTAPTRPRRAPARTRGPHPASDSRQRILAAAATEFALRGFAAAGVDRIANRARLNKAMIYYHFRSKQNLYGAVLRDIFGFMGDTLQAIAALPVEPAAKLDRFVEVLVHEGSKRPHFAPIVLREIAEGGRRLDEETYTLMLRVVRAVTGIVSEGRDSGQFGPVDPVLFHLTTVWPVLVYLATEPIRASIARIAKFDVARFEPDRFIHHMQTMNRHALSVRADHEPSAAHAR